MKAPTIPPKLAPTKEASLPRPNQSFDAPPMLRDQSSGNESPEDERSPGRPPLESPSANESSGLAPENPPGAESRVASWTAANDANPSDLEPIREEPDPSDLNGWEVPRRPADEEFDQLDPRSIALSRLSNLIGNLIFGMILVAGGIGLLFAIDFPFSLLIPLGWWLFATFAVINTVWWPKWHFQHWSYCVGEKIIELRYGVCWHVSVVIPLSRIQHVDLHRGPLERRFGLATLEIHTAGTRDASHSIAGLELELASRLRDQLIDIAHRGTDGNAND